MVVASVKFVPAIGMLEDLRDGEEEEEAVQ